jgi:4-carboxymuconolactone decarboxylase
MTSSLLPPLADEEWPPRLAGVAATLGSPLNVHRVLAHHPALLEAWMPFRQHITGAGGSGSTLAPRAREVVILRVAHRLDAAYEWAHHAPRARALGMADDELDALRADPPGARLSPDDAALVRAVDDLCLRTALSEDTARELHEALGPEGLLDLLFTVATYTALAFVLRSFDVPIDAP